MQDFIWNVPLGMISKAETITATPAPEFSRRVPQLRGAVTIGAALFIASLVLTAACGLGWVRGDSAPAVSGGQSSETVLSLDSPRVVVLKAKRLMHLLDGDRLVRTYPIDLGTSPRGPKRLAGDGRTPTGTFRVVAKNAGSPYFRFLGIDYPHEEAVHSGLQSGLISPGEAAAIRAALQAGQCPDWGTALGGAIGIHGRRIGRDWTAGCIALSDQQVDELYAVLRIGDPIEILP